MRNSLSFWRKCLGEAAGGSSPFANDWQWAVGNPTLAAVSPAVVAGLAAWLGQDYMMTEHPILGPFAVAFAAYVLTWLFALVIRTLGAAPKLYQQEKERADSVNAEMAKLISEYAYSFQLTNIDQEDRRRLDPQTNQIAERRIRFMLRLRNAIARPIRYKVSVLRIGDSAQENARNTGGVIQGNGTQSYYSHWVSVPVESIDQLYSTEIELHIEYGHPDSMTRKVVKVMEVEVIPNQALHMIYLTDDDQPLEGVA